MGFIWVYRFIPTFSSS